MALRDTLGKVAGLFVEIPEQSEPAAAMAPDDFDKKLADIEAQNAKLGARPTPGAKTVEQIVSATPGPNLNQVQVPQAAAAALIRQDGVLDFAAIYKQANLPVSTVSAEQVLDMLASLPKEVPIDTRRQTLKVMLDSLGKSLGATPQTIVADASRKLAALSSFTDGLAAHTGDFVSQTQLEIASMEAQISEKRRKVEEAQKRQQDATAQCHAEGDRLDDILEFFSLDVPPSNLAPEAAKPAPIA